MRKKEAPKLLSLLDKGWKHLIFDNLAPQTKLKYARIQNIYMGFCLSTGLAPLLVIKLDTSSKDVRRNGIIQNIGPKRKEFEAYRSCWF